MEYYKAQAELAGMDDELPIIIFLVSKIRQDINMYSELALIRDYLFFAKDLDFEEKNFSSISVS